jgi:hypothetical protein
MIPFGGMQTTSANIRLDSNVSVAGLSVHLQSATSNYVCTLSKTGGVVLYRNGVSSSNIIASNASVAAKVIVSTFQSLTLTVSALYDFVVVFNNMTVITARDALGTGPQWGSSGMYASGTVTFRNFTISGACETGSCSLTDGQSCKYECKSGYTTNTTTNGMATCDSNGLVTGGILCISLPPTMLPQNFTIPEQSPSGTVVGQVIAKPANMDQELDFTIDKYYPDAGNGTFAISACGGNLRVLDPTALDFYKHPVFILTVKARPDGDDRSAKYANMSE